MKEWSSYSERLMWAMRRAGKTNQSELARLVGVKPQSIQYLCDPDSGAQGSTHTPALARELSVRADWLARGEGQPDDVAVVATRANEAASPGYQTEAVWRAEVIGALQLGTNGDVDQFDQPQASDKKGHVLIPVWLGAASAVRVKGHGLSPYVKDGQFLLLLKSSQDAQPEDIVLLTLRDGRKLVRELMVRRDDSVLVLPMMGGQPQAFELQDIAHLDVVGCVLPRRWWRAD